MTQDLIKLLTHKSLLRFLNLKKSIFWKSKNILCVSETFAIHSVLLDEGWNTENLANKKGLKINFKFGILIL